MHGVSGISKIGSETLIHINALEHVHSCMRGYNSVNDHQSHSHIFLETMRSYHRGHPLTFRIRNMLYGTVLSAQPRGLDGFLEFVLL